MGVNCKPIGKMKSIMMKVQNELEKEKAKTKEKKSYDKKREEQRDLD